MKKEKDIREDEIRIIGGQSPTSGRRISWWWIAIILVLAGAGAGVWYNAKRNAALRAEEPSFFEPLSDETSANTAPEWFGQQVDELTPGFCEIRDTVINDIALRIYIPHNAELSLHIGRMNKQDESVIYTAQAADIRADNGKIVGAFVLAGEPKAWGLSKKGFCAAIDGKVTIGVAENSPLFEQATDTGGYFFRQYPLVDNGVLVENTPKNKSIRRGICDRAGEIFMVETLYQESFHDFSQALVDLGVDNAIYLVGSTAYGWAVDGDGTRHEFGEDNYYSGRRSMPKNTSYIVWRIK